MPYVHGSILLLAPPWHFMKAIRARPPTPESLRYRILFSLFLLPIGTRICLLWFRVKLHVSQVTENHCFLYPRDMCILYRALKSLDLFLLVFLQKQIQRCINISNLLHCRPLYCILFTSCFRCSLNLWLALITWYGYTSKHSFHFWIEHGHGHQFVFLHRLLAAWYGCTFKIDSWAR